MKLNRKLVLILALVLSLAMATGGTLAYLTSEDADVNVMTLGKVEIEQHEYQRVVENGSYKTDTIDNQNSYVLEAFEQAKPLLPIVGDPSLPGNNAGYAGWDDTTVRMSQVDSYGGMQVFAGKNAQDKFVTVENTGKSDAYVRTIIAFESGSITVENFDNVISSSVRATSNPNEIGTKVPWSSNFIGSVNIDGNNYMVWEYVYAGAQLSDGSYRHAGGVLPAGDTTYPNLSQVYMKSAATNEDVEAIDGNGNGTYDIMVLSQAVQADGFDNATTALNAGFGEVNAANVQSWFGGLSGTGGEDDTSDIPADAIYVQTFAELKAAVAKGGNVALLNDIEFEEPIIMENGENVVLYMNGKTITPESAKADPFFDTYPGTSLVITGNGTFNLGNNPGMSILMPGGDVTIKNGTFLKDRSDNVNGPMIAAYTRAEGKFIIEGGYFDSGYYREGDCFNNCRNGVNLTSGNTYYIYGGTFVGQNPAWGDEGRAVLCPHCNNDGSNCQGVFLEGQTKTSTELPEGYTITEGVTEDGRPTYTVNYSK